MRLFGRRRGKPASASRACTLVRRYAHVINLSGTASMPHALHKAQGVRETHEETYPGLTPLDLAKPPSLRRLHS